MSNHLKQETSPYLLQHAENPVEWYPWGEEAFERAKQEDKPIFLSIGYSTCHWCHVMAHESFEEEAVAELLNEGFISIKVDREERPDIDSVYMSVCQAFTGSGGWPMSVFMTWEKRPFFAGTYFPPESRYGMLGFSELLRLIQQQWRENREKLLEEADRIVAYVGEESTGLVRKSLQEERGALKQDSLVEQAVQIFSESFDSRYGGFGAAPKFPTPHNLLFLMLYADTRQKQHQKEANSNKEGLTPWGSMQKIGEMVEKTLTQMRIGGIFDQIGGGFSRYSTDRYFLAPHFEKMLYDNALLMITYAVAYQMTGKALYLETAKETADYVLREMTLPEGSFYSAQDADSEGVEGRYYTFTLDEMIAVLGRKKGKLFAKVFDITEKGNFDGKNIPNLLKQENQEKLLHEFQEEKRILYDYRKKRAFLHLDDKVLLSWNAMMVTALAMLFRVCGEKQYLFAAQKAQAFLEKQLWHEKARVTKQRQNDEADGLLSTSWRNGTCSDKAFLDDYAYEIAALLELYQATLEQAYFDRAEALCQETMKRFAERTGEDKHVFNGFFLCETGQKELFLNPKEVYDGAIPSGNSVMAYNLVRLYQLTEQEEYKRLAGQQLRFLSTQANDYPAGHSLFLLAKLLYENPPEHVIVVVAKGTQRKGLYEEVIRAVKPSLLANIVIREENPEYPLLNGKTTYYICQDFQCLPAKN